MSSSEVSMRRVVLYIDSFKLGGAERITLTWSSWLRDAGWSPVLLTRKPLTWDFYPLPDGVERLVETSDRRWVRWLGVVGFPVRVWRLRRWLKREQISLAIGVTSIPAIKLLLASRGLGIPTVVSERNFPPLKRIGLVWRLLRRWVYPWAALHLVQTQVVADWQAAHLGVRDQLLLPNPVQWPLDVFDPQLDPCRWLADAGVSGDAPVLLGVGTKAHQKGFDRLIDWFLALADRHQDLQLVLVGLDQRPYRGRDQQIELLARVHDRPDLVDRIHLPGRVGNMADWYDRATLFVLASRYEGFPNVLLEAMAAGCCCVAADCPQGPSELITSDYDGILIPAERPDAFWVDQLDAMLIDSDLRQRLGREAQAVRQRFASELLRKRCLERLEQLLPSV
ncbi:Protein Glycosylation H [Prochlorococcus marinus str. MIT 1313]|uniref:glycosyltransferase n=1 Tax=Prochlorococcus TaxID=1218 RepID=UPI0007B3BA61|nr:glycosyltransferase [Prochlorococcus marinus]KZR68542.1 Protein Glycosylation H [Prochlorococcus marinus str. MIT 1313]KZR71221.1 Protein Glycosylation H [Prochlorococcus marinus str. MIT 1318]